MTNLTLDDFEAFFTAVHGYPPFAWQTRLCHTIGQTGEWPESIAAPTGTGKSNVVDIHAFVNALYGLDGGPRVPRRLAVVVNRRAIVDAHEQRALELQATLREQGSEVVALVAEGLRRLRHESVSTDDVLALATLRGGLLPDRSWIDDPTSCQIICATPDMWGSRLLFGGYGSSPQAQPREAGLLAFDSVMVLDEAHLNKQLLTTARRVRELALRYPTPAPALQVVATTATPESASGERSAGVWLEDVNTDDELRRRLTRAKPVTYRATDAWPGKRPASATYVNEIADAVVEMWNENADGTVGCMVNTVSTAVHVAKAIRNRLSDKAVRNDVLTWVGPMRPMDLATQISTYPNAFRPAGDDRVGVVVATQTIEVGVDIDFAALVTELAPGSAIAQRAGRVNRLGSRDAGPILVIGPEIHTISDSGPYSAEELAESREWLLRRSDDPNGLSPLAIAATADSAPAAASPRIMFARLESGDAEALASTYEDLAAPQERSLWLRDDLEPDRMECGIALRAPLPLNDLDALALLLATPPAAAETFHAPLFRAGEICRALGKQSTPLGRAFVWRDNTVHQMDLGAGEQPKPGDVLILDSCHPITCEHTIVDYEEGDAESFTVWGVCDADGVQVEVLWREEALELFEQIDDVLEDADLDPDGKSDVIQKLVSEALSTKSQVTVGRPFVGSEREVPWLVLTPQDVITNDDETRQTWVGRKPVSLDVHSAAVGARARELAVHLSMSDAEAEILELAGFYHDAGKQDSRFQRALGTPIGEPPRAKSGGASSRRAKLAKARSGLPSGWRHEQLSVVFADSALPDHDRDRRELVLRLVGTSHGRGRSSFPHGAKLLVDPRDPESLAMAIEFFDQGGWEALIEATHRTVGPWACAYYEALLRAADCTVSKEGS